MVAMKGVYRRGAGMEGQRFEEADYSLMGLHKVGAAWNTVSIEADTDREGEDNPCRTMEGTSMMGLAVIAKADSWDSSWGWAAAWGVE